VALRVPLGILGTDQSAFYQPSHIRMIASETLDVGIANQVESAIADVRKIKMMVKYRERRTGSSHSLKSRMLLGIIQNATMSRGK
jgi:hypothetical protein